MGQNAHSAVRALRIRRRDRRERHHSRFGCGNLYAWGQTWTQSSARGRSQSCKLRLARVSPPGRETALVRRAQALLGLSTCSAELSTLSNRLTVASYFWFRFLRELGFVRRIPSRCLPWRARVMRKGCHGARWFRRIRDEAGAANRGLGAYRLTMALDRTYE